MGSALAPSHPCTIPGYAHRPQEATGSCRRPTHNSLRPHTLLWSGESRGRHLPAGMSCMQRGGRRHPPPLARVLWLILHKIHTHTAKDRCDLLCHMRPSHGQSAPVPPQGWLVQLVTQVSLMSPCPSGCPAHPVPFNALLSLTPLNPPFSESTSPSPPLLLPHFRLCTPITTRIFSVI